MRAHRSGRCFRPENCVFWASRGLCQGGLRATPGRLGRLSSPCHAQGSSTGLPGAHLTPWVGQGRGDVHAYFLTFGSILADFGVLFGGPGVRVQNRTWISKCEPLSIHASSSVCGLHIDQAGAFPEAPAARQNDCCSGS